MTMLLKDYLKKVGDEQAAQVLGVKQRTVQAWRLGQRLPRTKAARQIVERTGGAVTLDEIYKAS